MSNTNKQFDLEHQWDLYLQRVGLKGKRMPANQYREMKTTFYGACGQMMVLLRDDISALEDEEAMKVLQDLMDQVGNFFIRLNSRQN